MTDNTTNKNIEKLKVEIEELKTRLKKVEESFAKENNLSDDELTEEAIKIVKKFDKASTSLLQRRLSIGYTRAARLMDILEEKGIIESGGAGSRKVIN